MKRFQNVLVLADDLGRHSPAYQWSVRLARRHGARVTLAYALDLDDADIERRDESGGLTGLVIDGVRARLSGVIAPARRAGLHVEATVLTGIPSIEIIRRVLQGRHDLLLRTAHPDKGARSRLFNSLDMALLRKCPCPVWMAQAPPKASATYTRVLAALDPTGDEPERHELNHRILELAQSLAGGRRRELHVVHAWSLFGESVLRSGRHGLRKSEVDRLVADERDRRAERLDALIGALSHPVKPQLHLIKGRAADVVPATAARLHADIVVMGTVARTGVSGFLMGNTAEEVLGRVRCSVMAVKPRGFVTSVELPKTPAASRAAHQGQSS